jgi:hypothetical protein
VLLERHKWRVFSPVQNTLEPVEKALRDAKMDKSSIHDIVLVGGSTRYLQRDSVLRIRIFQGIYLDNGTGTCSLNVSFILLCAVLRIRDPVPYWPRDPGLVKNHDPDPG